MLAIFESSKGWFIKLADEVKRAIVEVEVAELGAIVEVVVVELKDAINEICRLRL